MARGHVPPAPARLDLARVDVSLRGVEAHWEALQRALIERKIGARDTPFTALVRANMLSAYTHLDEQLRDGRAPCSPASLVQCLALNHRVHYGEDARLRREFRSAIGATTEKFHGHIAPIADWYQRHKRRGDAPHKLAAEIYVSILGQPQLFIEGNHRTGTLIASWIAMYYGEPPFVLSAGNAIAYFAPSAAIKKFADTSTWRGRTRLPKYRKSFYTFWRAHTDRRYLLQ